MQIHQNLEVSGMEIYCSAGWTDRPYFKGQFSVERLIKSRWETFWEISRQRFSISMWLSAHLWLHCLLLFLLCFWTWLPLWIPCKQVEVKQLRCGKMVAWGKTARRGLSLAPAFSTLKCLILVLLMFSCSVAKQSLHHVACRTRRRDWVCTCFPSTKRSSHINSTGLG